MHTYDDVFLIKITKSCFNHFHQVWLRKWTLKKMVSTS